MPEDRRVTETYFIAWTVKTEGVILPEERLPTGQTILVGLQHVVAMFGATVLAPLLMGFDPNVAIFFSGIATLIFFVVTGGRVPSYLGSSFAFIGPVLAATGAAVAAGPNANIGLALGGIIAAGALYLVIGLVVIAAGHHWVENLRRRWRHRRHHLRGEHGRDGNHAHLLGRAVRRRGNHRDPARLLAGIGTATFGWGRGESKSLTAP